MKEQNNKAILLAYKKDDGVKVSTLDIGDKKEKVKYSSVTINSNDLTEFLKKMDKIFIVTDISLDDLTNPKDPEQVQLLLENEVVRLTNSPERIVKDELFKNVVLEGILTLGNLFDPDNQKDWERVINGMDDGDRNFIRESFKFLKDLVESGELDFDINNVEKVLDILNSNKK